MTGAIVVTTPVSKVVGVICSTGRLVDDGCAASGVVVGEVAEDQESDDHGHRGEHDAERRADGRAADALSRRTTCRSGSDGGGDVVVTHAGEPVSQNLRRATPSIRA